MTLSIAELQSNLQEAGRVKDEKNDKLEELNREILKLNEIQSNLESTLQKNNTEKEEILMDMQELGAKMKVWIFNLITCNKFYSHSIIIPFFNCMFFYCLFITEHGKESY